MYSSFKLLIFVIISFLRPFETVFMVFFFVVVVVVLTRCHLNQINYLSFLHFIASQFKYKIGLWYIEPYNGPEF